MTEYNINELLEMKKHLEAKFTEMQGKVTPDSLMNIRDVVIDHKTDKERVFADTEIKTLEQYVAEANAVQDELSSVRAAITKYNATVLKDLLFTRDATRAKIEYLKKIKGALPPTIRTTREILRQGKEGEVLESHEVIKKPFFTLKDVEKMSDEFAKQERKLNTQIQKLNLNEKVVL